MSTRVKTPVVPSATTPDMAVHPAAPGTEVPGPVPDTPGQAPAGTPVPAVGAGTPVPAPATAPPPKGVMVAMAIFLTALTRLVDDLLPYLEPEPVGTSHGPGALSARRRSALALVAALIRQHPEMGSATEADAIDAGAAAGTSARTVITVLEVLLSRLKLTARRQDTNAWSQASVAIQTGTAQARKNGSLTVALAPIKATLRQGPRTTTTAATANTRQQKAHAAQQRATKAQQRATTAQRSAARAVQAHADAHPTSAGAIPVTSPVPVANPQGPAASADVNPQGPAPGR